MAMFINREELAFAGGFFAGEGHVGAAKHVGRYHRGVNLRIDMQQTKSTELLDRFNQAVGNILKINGPYKKKNPKHATAWALRCHGLEKTQAVIAMIWPWIGLVKQKQYIDALTLWKARENRGKGGRPKNDR